MIKCGSCTTSKAEKYKKVDTRLFEILKNLNSRREYDPEDLYFCGKCVAKAKIEQDSDDISDQSANSLTLTTSISSDSSTASSMDEYDIMVEMRRILPLKRSRPFTGGKPCPKRYKLLRAMKQNSGDQNEAPPEVSTEETSPKQGHDTPNKELIQMILSTPSSAHQTPNVSEVESDQSESGSTSSNGSRSKKRRRTYGGVGKRNPGPSTTSGGNRTDQRPSTTSGRMEPQPNTRRFNDGGDSD